MKDGACDQVTLPERRNDVHSPVASTTTPVSAAAKHQHDYDDYQY
jgi:hypothetical protein